MNCIFWRGWGRGQEGQINKYVWGYDEIIFLRFGESFLSIRGFFMVKVQIWKIFLGLLNFKYFLSMPAIPDIFGIKSRSWVQAYVFRKIKSNPNGFRIL